MISNNRLSARIDAAASSCLRAHRMVTDERLALPPSSPKMSTSGSSPPTTTDQTPPLHGAGGVWARAVHMDAMAKPARVLDEESALPREGAPGVVRERGRGFEPKEAGRVESERRAARALRRAYYPGEVVRHGAPEPGLYAGLSPVERLARMSELCRAIWLASGHALEVRPRSEWPGEIFVIRRG
jgi:hypothetical protein